MVYTYDYIPVLESFEWPLALNKLAQKYVNGKNDKIINTFSGYLVYYRYTRVIWLRLIYDLKIYQSLKNTRDKRIFPPGRTGPHTLTTYEKDLMASTDAAQTGLEIDYESFLIFVNILFTKMAQIVASILSGDKKNQVGSIVAGILIAFFVIVVLIAVAIGTASYLYQEEEKKKVAWEEKKEKLEHIKECKIYGNAGYEMISKCNDVEGSKGNPEYWYEYLEETNQVDYDPRPAKGAAQEKLQKKTCAYSADGTETYCYNIDE